MKCTICENDIVTMCFKGTGVCGENCRKRRDEPGTQQYVPIPERDIPAPEGSSSDSESLEREPDSVILDAIGFSGAGFD